MGPPFFSRKNAEELNFLTLRKNFGPRIFMKYNPNFFGLGKCFYSLHIGPHPNPA